MFRRLPYLVVLVAALLLPGLSACDRATPWPPDPGFNLKESDEKALALADEVMAHQGGYARWQQARYLAWTYYGAYHIWDKKLSLYRQEKKGRVVLMSLKEAKGKIFADGKQLLEPDQTQEILGQTFMIWRFASDFLVLPFRLKDAGVTLRYGGTGVTMARDTADILEMTYKDTGPTGDARNQLWVSRKTHLVTQWAFYQQAAGSEPAFVRDWLDYRNYDGLLLASQRNSSYDTLSVSHISVLDTLPPAIFFSALPVNKAEVAAWGNRKK